MRLEDISRFVSEQDHVTKIKTTAEESDFGFMVTLTETTYVFDNEEDADAKINEARQNNGFAAATKKYKAGKMNKAGELIKPETWTVVIKINQ